MTALSSGHFSIQTSCQWVKLKSNKLRMIHGEKNKEPKKNWKPNKHRTKLSVIIYSTHHKKSWKKNNEIPQICFTLLYLSLVSSYIFMSIAGISTPTKWEFHEFITVHVYIYSLTWYLVIEFSFFFSFPSIICLVCISFSFRRITLDTMKSEHFNCLHDLQAFQWHFDIFVSVLSLIL